MCNYDSSDETVATDELGLTFVRFGSGSGSEVDLEFYFKIQNCSPTVFQTTSESFPRWTVRDCHEEV